MKTTGNNDTTTTTTTVPANRAYRFRPNEDKIH